MLDKIIPSARNLTANIIVNHPDYLWATGLLAVSAMLISIGTIFQPGISTMFAPYPA